MRPPCHPEEAKPTKDLAPGAWLDFHIATYTSAALRLRRRGGYQPPALTSPAQGEVSPELATVTEGSYSLRPLGHLAILHKNRCYSLFDLHNFWWKRLLILGRERTILAPANERRQQAMRKMNKKDRGFEAKGVQQNNLLEDKDFAYYFWTLPLFGM
jgi:hypothetical protein